MDYFSLAFLFTKNDQEFQKVCGSINIFNDNFLTNYYISWKEEQKYTFLKIFFAYQRYAKFEFGPFEPQVMSSWHEISKCIFTKFEPPILNFCIDIYTR